MVPYESILGFQFFFIGGVSAPIFDNIIMIFGCVFINNES